MLITARKKFPPGPNLLTLTSEFGKTPCLNLQYLAQQYGPICKTPGTFGYYLLTHPDYIEYVLKVNHRNYIKADLAYQGIGAVLGLNLLTNPDYDSWLVERKLLQPLFHYHHFAHYAKMITDATLALCQRWQYFAKQQKPFNLITEMFNLLFSIISKTLFSGDFADNASDFYRFNDLGNNYIGKALFLCAWFPSPHTLRFKQARSHVNQIIADVIEKRRRCADYGNPHDLITLLLKAQQAQQNPLLTDNYIIDEIKTFLITGTETTSTALTWLWYCLATNPEANDRLRYELTAQLNGSVPSAADAERLAYTRMVFEETLRLYPPLWIVSRRAVAPDHIDGYFVPKKKTIVISPFVIQRHPDFWSQPNQFNPNNFSEENKRKRLKNTYLPFGAGPRACIGSVFSSFEAQLIIPIIAQRFDFELLATEPVGLTSHITLRPAGGIWVKVKDRY